MVENHSLGEAPFGCKRGQRVDSFLCLNLTSEGHFTLRVVFNHSKPSGCKESRPIACSASLSESDVRRTLYLASGFQPLGFPNCLLFQGRTGIHKEE